MVEHIPDIEIKRKENIFLYQNLNTRTFIHVNKGFQTLIHMIAAADSQSEMTRLSLGVKYEFPPLTNTIENIINTSTNT